MDWVTWPVAVVISVLALLVYAFFDTWIKQPYLRKEIADMKIVGRGVVAVNHIIASSVKDGRP